MKELSKGDENSSSVEFSKFLLDLYSVASRVRVDEFRPEVFRLLDRLLRIDSAWWGTGVIKKQKFVIAQSSLYNLESDFLSEYVKVLDRDPLVAIVNESDGVAIAWSDGGKAGPAAVNEFDVRYGLYFGISCIQKEPTSGVGMFISVYRNEHGPAFNETERLLMQTALAHLVQAWSINLRLALASESSAQVPDACLIDANGRVIEISHALVDKLHVEFPDWHGDILPEKLRHLFVIDHADFYRGKSINIWSAKNSDGQLRLHCEPIRRSVLTPREESVAQAFAKGSSYKEIATALNLSPGTVRSYLTQCYSKLDVKNKIELGNALGKK